MEWFPALFITCKLMTEAVDFSSLHGFFPFLYVFCMCSLVFMGFFPFLFLPVFFSLHGLFPFLYVLLWCCDLAHHVDDFFFLIKVLEFWIFTNGMCTNWSQCDTGILIGCFLINIFCRFVFIHIHVFILFLSKFLTLFIVFFISFYPLLFPINLWLLISEYIVWLVGFSFTFYVLCCKFDCMVIMICLVWTFLRTYKENWHASLWVRSHWHKVNIISGSEPRQHWKASACILSM